jgi:hypothetical protein
MREKKLEDIAIPTKTGKFREIRIKRILCENSLFTIIFQLKAL